MNNAKPNAFLYRNSKISHICKGNADGVESTERGERTSATYSKQLHSLSSFSMKIFLITLDDPRYEVTNYLLENTCTESTNRKIWKLFSIQRNFLSSWLMAPSCTNMCVKPENKNLKYHKIKETTLYFIEIDEYWAQYDSFLCVDANNYDKVLPIVCISCEVCVGEPQIDNVEDNDELTEQNEKMICDTRMLEHRMKMHYPQLLMIIHA